MNEVTQAMHAIPPSVTTGPSLQLLVKVLLQTHENHFSDVSGDDCCTNCTVPWHTSITTPANKKSK